MVRQKIKKFTLLLGVAVVLATPISGLVPLFGGSVHAAVPKDPPAGTWHSGTSGSLAYGASVDTNAQEWVLARSVASCFYKSDFGYLSQDSATSGKWFQDGHGGDNAIDEGIVTEILVEGQADDGQAPCNNVVTTALSYIKVSPINALCGMGATRANGTDCESGNGDFSITDSKGLGEDWSAKLWTIWFAKAWYGQEISGSTVANADAADSWWLGNLNDGMKFYIYSTAFQSQCSGGTATGWQDSYGTADHTTGVVSDQNGQAAYRLPWWASAGDVEDSYVTTDQSADHTWGKADKIDSSISGDTNNHNILAKADFGGSSTPQCQQLSAAIINYADSYNAAVTTLKNDGIDPAADTSTDGTGDGVGIDCFTWSSAASIFSLSWVVCPIINGLQSIAQSLENSIDGMLCVNENTIFSTSSTQVTSTCTGASGATTTGNSFYAAWNSFRLIALGLLAIAGLVMVISQGLGFELVDAYTLKKTLPRIILAAIGISLSWWIAEFAVQISNSLGIAIRSLIYQPFLSNGIDKVSIAGGWQTVGGIFAMGGIVLLGPLGGLSLLLTAVLAIAVAFFTLVIRNTLIIMLIIFAPLGFAFYVLPNTEKYWKMWWDWFSRALLAFPIITALIAIGHVFAAVTSKDDSGGMLDSMVAFISYFAPYFLIPLAFRMAGGALATLSGMANDRGRGMFDRISKYRQGQMQKRGAYYGQKYGDRAMQARAEAVRALDRKASTKGAVGSWALRAVGRQIGGLGDIEERMSAIQARASKRANDQIATGKDDAYRGLTVDRKTVDRATGNDTASMRAAWEAGGRETFTSADGLKRIDKDGKVQYKSLGGGWVDQADVDNAHREYGHDVGAQQAALSYEMRKAMEAGDIDGMHERFNGVADAWGMTKTQRQGAWIGAGFENQNQHLGLKYTKFDDSGNMYVDYDGLAKEAYEKKGSYQLSQMSGQTIRDMRAGLAESKAAIAAGATGDDLAKHQARIDRFKGVAETFMHDMTPATAAGVAAAGEPPLAAGSSASGRRFNANGAAAVNEEAYQLARETGVLSTPPNNSDSGPYNPPVPGRSQGN